MSGKWDRASQDDIREALKDTEMGKLTEKIETLMAHLEGLVEKDKQAIMKVEREIAKMTAQRKGRVKDEQ